MGILITNGTDEEATRWVPRHEGRARVPPGLPALSRVEDQTTLLSRIEGVTFLTAFDENGANLPLEEVEPFLSRIRSRGH